MRFRKWLCFVVLFGLVPKAQAYITYLNGRIDRALYDAHDPKTVVAGKISHVHYREKDAAGSRNGIMMWEGPDMLDIDFTISSVIMGDGKLTGKKINLATASFTWPDELIEAKEGIYCIFILRDWNYKPDSTDLHIEVVIPAIEREVLVKSPPYLRIRDNKTAILFLENELLTVLDQKLSSKSLRETLILLGPILQKEHCNKIEKFVANENKWVQRAALADIVYASLESKYLNLLAADMDTYFSLYVENETVANEDEYNGYSANYLYYRFVFFLDPDYRNWGTRWDGKEEYLNKRTCSKLKETGLLSKEVCKKLTL
jgi:hypothetical protein